MKACTSSNPFSPQVAASFSGLSWNKKENIHRLQEASSWEAKEITRLELSHFDIDVNTASLIVQIIQKNRATITDLSILDCTGHINIVTTVVMAIAGLESLRIGSSTLHLCSHSLGVGLLTSTSLKHIELHSGKSRYFTLVAESATSLAKGLEVSKSLRSLVIKRCRFGDNMAIRTIGGALKANSSLQGIVLSECFSANGQAIPDDVFKLFFIDGKWFFFAQVEGLLCLFST